MDQLAAAFNSRMRGRASVLSSRTGGTKMMAVRAGRAIARFFGASSPKTICSAVARVSAIAAVTAPIDPGGTQPSSGCSNGERAPSTTHPRISELTVMPSWAPDSWNDNVRSALSTGRAPRTSRLTMSSMR